MAYVEREKKKMNCVPDMIKKKKKKMGRKRSLGRISSNGNTL